MLWAVSWRLVGLVSMAISLPAVAAAQCAEQALSTFETDGYSIRRVLVKGPFVNASALGDRLRAAGVVAGAPLRMLAVESGRRELRRTLLATPALFDSLVAATVVETYGEACQEDTKQLDIVYRVFTTKLALGSSRTLEGMRGDGHDPSSRLAMGVTPVRYRVSPLFRYNALEKAVGGARLSLTAPPRGIGRMDLAVETSSAVTNVGLEVWGSRSADAALIRAAEWRVSYRNRDRLTEANRLEDQRLAAQVSAMMRPMGAAGSVFRGASSLEIGDQTSTIARTNLPAPYTPHAGYGSWKGAVGATVRFHHHALSTSHGLELGMTKGSNAFDYKKVVGELDYQGRLTGTHRWWRRRPIDVSGRLGWGLLRGRDHVPVGSRFFGDSGEPSFLAGDGWTFGASPALRGFPASSFAGIGSQVGAGGDSFASFNVTTSMPVWTKPLVPPDVSSDQTVRQSLSGQLQTGENALATLHKMKDPSHAQAVKAGRSLAAPLMALRSRLEVIMPSVPQRLRETAGLCEEQADTFSAVVESVSDDRYAGGLLLEPVDEGDATLTSVLRVCIDELARPLNDSELLQAGAAIASAKTALEGAISRIDAPTAERLAARDMAFARTAVTAIFDELNAVAVGPILVFDAARLGQRDPPSHVLNRYSLGAGVRLSVASALHVSLGYARNLKRAAGERRGAVFASIELSTLFGN